MNARPCIKIVGGKRQLLPMLLQHVPLAFNIYHEPFVGGGALFFALRPVRAVISDANARLIAMYRGVRENVNEVIANLRHLEEGCPPGRRLKQFLMRKRG